VRVQEVKTKRSIREIKEKSRQGRMAILGRSLGLKRRK
jgi:hypothetical protein